MAEFNERAINMDAVPAPGQKSVVVEEPMEFNQDDILALINSVDEDGHCPCHILASLEVLTDVKEGMTLQDVPDDNRTEVDDMTVEDCTVDMFTMDGEFVNVVLTFNSVKNAYLRELKAMLDRYRLMQEEISENPDATGRIPVFSISFMPKALEGRGLMTVSFPISYFRTLDDAGLNTSLHVFFHLDNVQFMRVELDENAVAEIEADVLREMEAGTNGELFDE